jgi:hypothetical protein
MAIFKRESLSDVWSFKHDLKPVQCGESTLKGNALPSSRQGGTTRRQAQGFSEDHTDQNPIKKNCWPVRMILLENFGVAPFTVKRGHPTTIISVAYYHERLPNL